jgi:phosphotransferase system enzyme I (PtsP)
MLLGLGYDHLSMSANSLLKVKSMLSQVSKAEARSLAKRALRMSDADSVALLLSDALNRPELSKLYRPAELDEKAGFSSSPSSLKK